MRACVTHVPLWRGVGGRGGCAWGQGQAAYGEYLSLVLSFAVNYKLYFKKFLKYIRIVVFIEKLWFKNVIWGA